MGRAVIPGWSEGPDLRCALAHRGISKFLRCASAHRSRCAPPRNDGVKNQAATIRPETSRDARADRNCRSISAAGSGRLNRNPCISVHPSEAMLSELFGGFHALGGGRHAHAVGERGNRAHDVERARILGDVLDEGTVDLDLVEREALQVGQRRISGAEIVHRDPDPERPQLMQHRKRGLLVVQQYALGDLDLQPRGCKAGSRERADDHLHQAGTAKLDRRNIDGDVKIVRPLRGGGAGLPDHPLAHRDDEADLFGQRNEVGRRDHPLARMIPAYQGLEAADFLARQVDHRLVVQLEFACRQRLAQVLLHDAAGLHLQVHHGFEEAERAAAVALGAVEREVGVAQQFVGVRSVAGADRNADADADHGLLAVDVIGLAQRVDDALCQRSGLGGVSNRRPARSRIHRLPSVRWCRSRQRARVTARRRS